MCVKKKPEIVLGDFHLYGDETRKDVWTRKEDVLRMQVVCYHITVGIVNIGFDGLSGSNTVLSTNNSCILRLDNRTAILWEKVRQQLAYRLKVFRQDRSAF